MRTLLLLVLVGCADDEDLGTCDAGVSSVVCSLSLEPQFSSSDDGGTTYAVTIEALVPNLRGGAEALVSTSSGVVAGSAPGSEANVFLAPSPAAPARSGLLQGQVYWSIPPGQTAELTIRIEEASATAEETAR